MPRAVDLRPQELLLSRHAEGLPGLAVRRADHRRRLDRDRRRTRRHRTCAPRRGHRQDRCTSAAAVASTKAAGPLVDYNRAGVPLMEIVSRPDIRSAEQARGRTCRSCGGARGGRRVRREDGRRLDAGRRQRVGAAAVGTTELGVKVEIKNMNSLRSLGARSTTRSNADRGAPSGRADRAGDAHWDEADGRTGSMRTKEGSSDYRYFPEPDLVPVRPPTRCATRCGRRCPSCRRRARPGRGGVGISEADARMLVGSPGWPSTPRRRWWRCTRAAAKDVVNWCNGDVLAHLNESGLSPAVLPLAPDGLAELVDLVADGTLSRAARPRTLEASASPSRSGPSRSSPSGGWRR